MCAILKKKRMGNRLARAKLWRVGRNAIVPARLRPDRMCLLRRSLGPTWGGTTECLRSIFYRACGWPARSRAGNSWLRRTSLERSSPTSPPTCLPSLPTVIRSGQYATTASARMRRVKVPTNASFPSQDRGLSFPSARVQREGRSPISVSFMRGLSTVSTSHKTNLLTIVHKRKLMQMKDTHLFRRGRIPSKTSSI